MGIPYTAQKQFTATGGEAKCVRLNVPYRGTLTRIVVKQISGAVNGFGFDIFDRRDACAGVDEFDSNPEDAELLDSDCHKIMESQTSGGAAIKELYQQAIPYINQDEQDRTSRRPLDALWMEITPGGAGDKEFNVALTIDQLSDSSG